MHTYRKILSAAAAVALMLTLLPSLTVGALAADSDFTVVNGVITAYRKTGTESFTIPDTINGMKITGVAENVFIGRKGLVSPLPSGLTTVGNSAFDGCTGLTSLPAGLTTIGAYAFANCTGLTNLPDNLTTVSEGAFMNCTGLKSLSAGLTIVGDLAFDGCTGLTSLPAGLTTVGAQAFYGCTGLTSLPAGLTTVGACAFDGCTGLSGSLPDSITTIGERAFSGCTGLSGSLPAMLETVGDYVFESCYWLTGNLPAGLKTVGKSTFYRCIGLTGNLPAGLKTVGEYAFFRCTGLTGSLPAGLTAVDACAFDGCKGLTGSIPAGLTTINTGAFSGCSGLTGLHDGITTVAASAFSGCGGLKGSLPAGLTTVGSYAFSGCNGLTGRLPAGLTTIGEKAFYGCSGLTYILTSNANSIGLGAFPTDATLYVPKDSYAQQWAVDNDYNHIVYDGKPLGIVSVTSQNKTLQSGETNIWTAKSEGGVGDIRYCFYIYKDGEIVQKGKYGASDTCSYVCAEPGVYQARAYAKDVAGTVKTLKGGTVTVTASAPAPKLASVASKYTTREVGQANRWTPKVTGGTAPLQYHYRLYKDGAVYQTFGWMSDISYRFDFTEPGEYVMQVRVKDANDARSEYVTSAKITVTEPAPKAPVLSSVATKYTSREVGQANRWTPKVTGGATPLQYHYRLYKDGAVYNTFGWKTDTSWAFTFAEPGEYVMQVRVKDANDARSEYVTSAKITVTEPAPKAPVLSSVATKYTSREVGQANRWTPAVTGGVAPLQYHYRLYKDGAVYQTFGWMSDTSYRFDFTEPGEYVMQVRVKDANDARSDYVTSPVITVAP